MIKLDFDQYLGARAMLPLVLFLIFSVAFCTVQQGDLIEAVTSNDLATIRTLSWLDEVSIDLMHLAIGLGNEEVIDLLLDTLHNLDLQEKIKIAEFMVLNRVKHQLILQTFNSTSVTHKLLLKLCHSGSIDLIRYFTLKLTDQPRPQRQSRRIENRPIWKFQQLFNSALSGHNAAAVLSLFNPGAYLSLLSSEQHCAMWNQLLETVRNGPLECEARGLFLNSDIAAFRNLELRGVPRVHDLMAARDFFSAAKLDPDFQIPMDIVGHIVILLLLVE